MQNPLRRCLWAYMKQPSFLATSETVHVSHRSGIIKFVKQPRDDAEKSSKIMKKEQKDFFDINEKLKNKITFTAACRTYVQEQRVYRRGHVEFIYNALENMDKFGVHKDLQSYKEVLNVFPKGKMIPKSIWQVEMMHYPKQQDCCIEVLEKMETNGIVPDDDMGYLLAEIFGCETHAFRKYQRMMYWMPKFKNANPYPVPYEMPEDPIEIAVLALKRMSVDLENKISVFHTEALEGSVDGTYIVQALAPKQMEFINEHSVDKPLVVRGGYSVWIKDKHLTYFALTADASINIDQYKKYQESQDTDDVSNLECLYSSEDARSQIVPAPSVHEQEDGTILAMCITGTGSKDSLISWIKFMQITIPKLKNIPILFSLITPESGIIYYKEETEKSVTTS